MTEAELEEKAAKAGGLVQKGDYAAAEALQREILREAQASEDPRRALVAQGNLAATLWLRGHFKAAAALETEVLESRSQLLGSSHEQTLRAKGNLAATLASLGDLASAAKLEREVLEQRPQLDEEALKAKGNLAQTLSQLGEPDAEALEQEVLAARRELLGEEHRHTLVSKGNLAALLAERGDLNGAMALEKEVLEARRRLLGDEHPDTMRAKINLASTYLDCGNPNGAAALQREVLEARRRALGNDDPQTWKAKYCLAESLGDMGDYEGADALRQEVTAARARLGLVTKSNSQLQMQALTSVQEEPDQSFSRRRTDSSAASGKKRNPRPRVLSEAVQEYRRARAASERPSDAWQQLEGICDSPVASPRSNAARNSIPEAASTPGGKSHDLVAVIDIFQEHLPEEVIPLELFHRIVSNIGTAMTLTELSLLARGTGAAVGSDRVNYHKLLEGCCA